MKISSKIIIPLLRYEQKPAWVIYFAQPCIIQLTVSGVSGLQQVLATEHVGLDTNIELDNVTIQNLSMEERTALVYLFTSFLDAMLFHAHVRMFVCSSTFFVEKYLGHLSQLDEITRPLSMTSIL